ncbi:MAG: tRNA epoxyqueuosine(34) reductase QueG [Phycisphaerales bacterium]|nr:tRNA epoxyqueuosine(34) reductase QueG [Phycisphaerales bacterium]
MSLETRVLERCHALGFARAGIADPAPTRYARPLLDWLAAGRHGEMAYLQRHVALLLDPAGLLPGVRAIICVADRYASGEPDPASPAFFGRIARYARGRDYHDVMRRRLHRLADELRADHPEHAFRVCVDTAPLLEREYAERAGIGAVGKHTLIIDRAVGSYLLLGELLTTLPLAASAPAPPDPCGACTRCIDACPTDAITPWSVDATRCISYVTIEHRTRTDAEIGVRSGDWIFGCDVCQEVCPHNQPTERTRGAAVEEAYIPRRTGFDLASILEWRESDRREAFQTSALKRAKLDMMKRNALIAAANALAREPHARLRARIEALAEVEDESALVRETARAVLTRLG